MRGESNKNAISLQDKKSLKSIEQKSALKVEIFITKKNQG